MSERPYLQVKHGFNQFGEKEVLGASCWPVSRKNLAEDHSTVAEQEFEEPSFSTPEF